MSKDYSVLKCFNNFLNIYFYLEDLINNSSVKIKQSLWKNPIVGKHDLNKIEFPSPENVYTQVSCVLANAVRGEGFYICI